jgi:plasmid stabilization system protein ParE
LKLRWTARAARDLERPVAFVEPYGEELAARLERDRVEAADRLTEYPRIGRRV